MIKKLVMLSVLAISVGCFGPSNNTQKGAVQGAVLGGLLGGVIGHQSGSAGEGAGIGAAAGAILGGAFAPTIATILWKEYDIFWVSVYIAGASILSLLSVMMLSETYQSDLTDSE